jgi:hypothetical protein
MFNKMLIMAAGFASVTSAQPAGLAMGLDHTVIDNWREVIVPDIVDTINALQIPDSHFSGGYAKHIKINLDQVPPTDVSLDFDPTNHGLYLSVTDIKG